MITVLGRILGFVVPAQAQFLWFSLEVVVFHRVLLLPRVYCVDSPTPLVEEWTPLLAAEDVGNT